MFIDSLALWLWGSNQGSGGQEVENFSRFMTPEDGTAERCAITEVQRACAI